MFGKQLQRQVITLIRIGIKVFLAALPDHWSRSIAAGVAKHLDMIQMIDSESMILQPFWSLAKSL